MAEASLAVHLARVPDRDGKRRRRARPDGDVSASRQREDRPRVARRGNERNVADDGGDAENPRLLMRAGVEEREGVVDAGVDVDDQRLGALRQGVDLSPWPYRSAAIAVEQAALWPGGGPGVKPRNPGAPCRSSAPSEGPRRSRARPQARSTRRPGRAASQSPRPRRPARQSPNSREAQ